VSGPVIKEGLGLYNKEIIKNVMFCIMKIEPAVYFRRIKHYTYLCRFQIQNKNYDQTQSKSLVHFFTMQNSVMIQN